MPPPSPLPPPRSPSPSPDDFSIELQSEEDLIRSLALNTNLTQLEIERANIRLTHGLLHPRIAIIDEEIAAIKLQLQEIGIIRYIFVQPNSTGPGSEERDD